MTDERREAGGAVFEEIRAACARVAGAAERVHIERDKLDAYARSLPVDKLHSPVIEPEHHYLGHGEQTVAYVLALDSINFGSGYFPELEPRNGLVGYFMVAHALGDFFEANAPVSAGDLIALTPEDCAEIFGQNLSNEAVAELMGLFSQALEDLGRFVLADFGGRFASVVEAAGGRASALVDIVSKMPLFRDVADYHDTTVPFYKRAQILAADLWLAFDGEGPGAFSDLDGLTLFADNLVPHVLRLDGLLRYDETLAERIDRGDRLEANSPEEVEIRACGVHVVELLVERLTALGRAVTAFELDNYLWHLGQDPRFETKPRHHTRTVYY
ncbi:hypothetical protein FIV42_05630 [Persicimonas caeni]|uniref:Queuosine 5'-phosphate N-glycosylase/hydrolase n=1 Tax=Persicimonas caeni TaxID=2292766 RepID=A0A4Y6PQD2_PERCE|nr:queuosine salvage family protein [Persicimonas caeni]QDG50227.1 hypothetical protein FIV42_05630 [Persicimonas caeni]QED31448.1 hypothetical protein FRD00_05625 [Persicimonas caeni]